jgi:hypothetical protein
VLILSVAVVGMGSGVTLPLTALTLTQAGYGTDVVGLLTAAQAGGGLLVVPLASWIAAALAVARRLSAPCSWRPPRLH